MTEATKVEKRPRTETVLEDLRDINEENDFLRTEIRIARETKGRAEKTVMQLEAKALAAVARVRGADGKQVYTSDPMRKAAAEALLQGDFGVVEELTPAEFAGITGEQWSSFAEHYEDCTATVTKLEIEININKNSIEKNIGEWKILFAEIDLLVAQLNASANSAVIEAIEQV